MSLKAVSYVKAYFEALIVNTYTLFWTNYITKNPVTGF